MNFVLVYNRFLFPFVHTQLFCALFCHLSFQLFSGFHFSNWHGRVSVIISISIQVFMPTCLSNLSRLFKSHVSLFNIYPIAIFQHTAICYIAGSSYMLVKTFNCYLLVVFDGPHYFSCLCIIISERKSNVGCFLIIRVLSVRLTISTN